MTKPKVIDIADEARQRIKLEKLRLVHGIEVIDGAELAAKEFPPIRWAVPNLLPEGYGIIGGKPKIGKSWLTYDIVLGVASGGCAIGSNEYPVEPGIALYIALEDYQRRLKGRQSTLLNGLAQGPKNLKNATDWKPLHEGGLDALVAWLEEFPETRLIVIDTLAHVKPPKKWADAYEHEMKIGKQLQTIAHKYNTCLLAVYHANKKLSDDRDFISDISGSTGIVGAPDFIMKLSRQRHETTGILQISGKDIQEIELALKFENCQWTLLENAQEYQLSKNQEIVYHTLKNSSEALTPKDISEHTGINKAYVGELLNNLLDAELIDKVGYGKYKAKI